MHTNPELLALLALGEHPDDPTDSAHLAECEQCRAELESLAQLIEQGRSAPDGKSLDVPSEAVWAAIQAELGFIPVTRSWPSVPESDPVTPPAVAETAPGSEATVAETAPSSEATASSEPAPAIPDERTQRSRRQGRRALSLVLAAALALVAGIGIGLAIDRVRQPSETVIGHATLDALPAWPGANGTATVAEDAAGNRTLVVDLHTPQPAGGDQQVWLINSSITAMQSVGFLNADGRGSLPIPPGTDLSKFPIVDVSDEPVDDTDVAHSGNSIVRGELQR